MQTAEAYARCLALTRAHYENFPVARLVPRRLQPAVAAVYAFARTADDIADEGYDRPGGPILSIEERLARLRDFNEALLASERGETLPMEWEWIFIAVADTRQKYNLPISLFQDLLSAFTQDVTKKRYDTFADLLDYCRRSANPVGKKGRVYVPQEDWASHGVSEADFGAAIASTQLRGCMRFQVRRTRGLFNQGRPLPASLPFPLSLEIRLTWLGGSAVLDRIAAQEFDTLSARPAIGTVDKVRLLLRAFFSI
jgi:phytoene synthase